MSTTNPGRGSCEPRHLNADKTSRTKLSDRKSFSPNAFTASPSTLTVASLFFWPAELAATVAGMISTSTTARPLSRSTIHYGLGGALRVSPVSGSSIVLIRYCAVPNVNRSRWHGGRSVFSPDNSNGDGSIVNTEVEIGSILLFAPSLSALSLSLVSLRNGKLCMRDKRKRSRECIIASKQEQRIN